MLTLKNQWCFGNLKRPGAWNRDSVCSSCPSLNSKWWDKNHVRASVFTLLGKFIFWMDMIWVTRWNGLEILIPTRMWKSQIPTSGTEISRKSLKYLFLETPCTDLDRGGTPKIMTIWWHWFAYKYWCYTHSRGGGSNNKTLLAFRFNVLAQKMMTLWWLFYTIIWSLIMMYFDEIWLMKIWWWICWRTRTF